MTAGWIPIFDASGSWPDDPQKVWDAGFRVIAGYVNEGSWKSFTAALRDHWITPAHPFAFAPMFEAVGNEPAIDPAKGTAHAKAARAGLEALFPGTGYASIAYAEDRDVSPGNANVKQYYENVKAADTVPGIGYIESDAGIPLTRDKVIAGVFEPAAYGWDGLKKVMTPDTAPPEVLWTQEHNGVSIAGSGNVDIGHIRTTAPIVWQTIKETDVAIDPNDVKTILTTDGIIPNWPWNPDFADQPGKPGNKFIKLGNAVVLAGEQAHEANVNAKAALGKVSALTMPTAADIAAEIIKQLKS